MLSERREAHAIARGKTAILVHLGGAEYFESRLFYPAKGYSDSGPEQMRKEL